MELRQLKYFVKVAEHLNFSEAAKLLYVSQSTLSQQVRQLEQEMGVTLFERDSHSVALTEAGEELLPYAMATLRSADNCFDRMNDLRKLLAGTLNIGVTYSFSPILTESLFSFMKMYPRVKLNIYYKSMEELMEMLAHRSLDFVLAFKPSVRYEGIQSHVLFDNHLAAIVRSGHPLSEKKSIALSELEHYELALPAKGLQARNAFESLVSRYFLNLKVRIELNEVNILLKLLKQSELVSVLSEATIHNEPGVTSIPIVAEGNEMQGCVHLLRNAYCKRSMQEFLRILGESNAVLERRRDWML